MPNARQTLSKRLKPYAQKPKSERVIIGRADGAIEVGSTEPMMIWVTNLEGMAYKLLNRRVPNVWGKVVKAGYDPNDLPNTKQVLGIEDTYPTAGWAGPDVMNHRETHDFGAGDCDWVKRERILKFVPVAGQTKFNIYPGAPKYLQATETWWAPNISTLVDFTASIPTSGARITLVVLDSSGSIAFRDGTAIVGNQNDLTGTDFPALTAGDTGIVALRLIAGMSEAKHFPGNDTFWDLSESGAYAAGSYLPIASISDAAYDAGTWDGDTTHAASKNAIRDKIEAMGGGYTDEQAQDAVGGILNDTATIDLTYTDATPEIKADVKADSVGVALMHSTATDKVFGRVTAGAGAGEEIAMTAAGRALIDDATAADQRTTLGLGTASTHADSDYAPVAKGVTNGDSHDHSGGDGSAITEAAITLADNTTNNASTTKHGFAPKAVAPAAGIRSVVAIDNTETVYKVTALLDTTNPAALGVVGPGTSLIAARRDHIHANPAIDTLAAATDITTLDASTSTHGLAPKAVAPAANELNVLGIANGETLYVNKDLFNTTTPGAVGTGEAGTAVQASRSDHVHGPGKLDDNVAPDDNTDLNASTTKHGLLIKAVAPAANVRNVVAIDNGETIYKIAAMFDGTNPADLGTSAPGTSLIAAHRDHVHLLPTPATIGIVSEKNANDVFRVDNPGSTSKFTALLNGDPTNAANSVCTFDTVSAGSVATITPTSTSQLAKLRIYNSTRGNSVGLVLSATGATFTTTANMYALGWRNNDSITTVSPTVSGGSLDWVDLEITSGPTNKTAINLVLSIASATINHVARLHPFDASFSTAKYTSADVKVANTTDRMYDSQNPVTNVISLAWTGTPTTVTIRESGYIQ